jgi:hypothetical protein
MVSPRRVPGIEEGRIFRKMIDNHLGQAVVHRVVFHKVTEKGGPTPVEGGGVPEKWQQNTVS